MICHWCIAQSVDKTLCISTKMLNIYIYIKHSFLHPHLLSSLHTFKACGKSVHNDIISFSTFCQPHWQASPPSKSLNKDCCHFVDWRTDLRKCCLGAPLVDGMFSIFLLPPGKQNHSWLVHLFCVVRFWI